MSAQGLAKGRKGRGAKCGAGAQNNSPASGPDRAVTRFTGEPPPTAGTGTGATVAQAMDQRICVLYKRLSGPWMSPTMHRPHHPPFLGGGGDGWHRRHSSKMVTRHYVFGFSNVHDCALLSRLLRGWQ